MPATRRTALLGMFGAMATLSLPRGARARPQPGLLRYGLSAWPPNLRPWVSTGASAGTVKMLLHRRLTRFNAQGELEGELAAEWRLDEDRAWVFRLRPEARFANGEPVTSRDVAWTIEQVAGERSTAYYAAQMRRIARVETPDAHTVRLVMREPLVTVPLWFANYNMPIGWHGSPDVNDPVAAGPYRIARQELLGDLGGVLVHPELARRQQHRIEAVPGIRPLAAGPARGLGRRRAPAPDAGRRRASRARSARR